MNKQDKMYMRIEEHGKKINEIFNTGLSNVELSKKLWQLERRASHLTVDQANTGADHSVKLQFILDKVTNLLYDFNVPTKDYDCSKYNAIFINQDPRGYALKISSEYVQEHQLDIPRDWGGYGILAPDLTEEVA